MRDATFQQSNELPASRLYPCPRLDLPKHWQDSDATGTLAVMSQRQRVRLAGPWDGQVVHGWLVVLGAAFVSGCGDHSMIEECRAAEAAFNQAAETCVGSGAGDLEFDCESLE